MSQFKENLKSTIEHLEQVHQNLSSVLTDYENEDAERKRLGQSYPFTMPEFINRLMAERRRQITQPISNDTYVLTQLISSDTPALTRLVAYAAWIWGEYDKLSDISKAKDIIDVDSSKCGPVHPSIFDNLKENNNVRVLHSYRLPFTNEYRAEWYPAKVLAFTETGVITARLIDRNGNYKDVTAVYNNGATPLVNGENYWCFGEK